MIPFHSKHTNTTNGGGGGGSIIFSIILFISIAIVSTLSFSTPISAATGTGKQQQQQQQQQPSNNDNTKNVCLETSTDSSCTSENKQITTDNHKNEEEQGDSSHQENSSSTETADEVMSMKQDEKVSFYHYSSVDSTQDEAKRILSSLHSNSNKGSESSCISISASTQHKGRGTSGRTWMSRTGNTFVSIAVPTTSIPVPLTLLPLKIGSIMAFYTKEFLQSEECSSTKKKASVTLKWPNDVLINHEKVAGVLIESASDSDNNTWFIIGVGVNVAFAPIVDADGPNRGRKSACLQQYCVDHDSTSASSSSGGDNGWSNGEKAKELAERISREVANWVVTTSSSSSSSSSSQQQQQYGKIHSAHSKAVVEEWSNWVEWGKELTMRDPPNENQLVIPLDVEPDGRLKVRDVNTGMEKLLVADYLL